MGFEVGLLKCQRRNIGIDVQNPLFHSIIDLYGQGFVWFCTVCEPIAYIQMYDSFKYIVDADD